MAQAAQPLPEGADALYEHAMAVRGDDPVRAAEAFEAAAMQGHGEAAYQLGQLQSDPKSAVGWYSMAAAIGQTDAQYALGEAYLEGRGTAREPAWGVSWFERAARAGNARAQYAMGAAMLSGALGPSQPEEAMVWFLVAEHNGFAGAGLMIDMLRSHLSKSVQQVARERADAWTNEPAGDAEERATTRFAQYALGRLGYEAGLPDGIRGERTDQAVQAFRDQENLGPGGLDGRTLDILRERIARLGR